MYRYNIRERVLPATLTCVPLLIFVDKLTTLHLYGVIKSMPQLLNALIGLVSAAVLIFLSTKLNRFILKKIVDYKYFNNEIDIPTADYLLWKNDSLDKETKEYIRSKIDATFGIVLMDERNEIKNEEASKRQIAAAVSQIKSSLHNNRLFIQQKIEYEFFLNLLAGCFTACLFSLALILLGDYYNYATIKTTGTILLTVYILPLLFRKFIIQQLITHYSKQFFKLFLGSDNY